MLFLNNEEIEKIIKAIKKKLPLPHISFEIMGELTEITFCRSKEWLKESQDEISEMETKIILISFEKEKNSEKAIIIGKDIEIAFNAGRESVVENMSELEFECEYPYTVDEARTPITVFHIFHNNDGFHLAGYGLGLSKIFGTLYEAKRFANEEYKKRIKQALGL